MRELYVGELKQGQAQTINILLLNAAGAPVSLLTPADVTLEYMRVGDLAFNPFALNPANFVEILAGFYQITLDSIVTAIEGNLVLRLTGIPFDWTGLRYYVQGTANLGNVQTTITIVDATLVPLPETQVDIWDSGMTGLIWSGTTDVAGQVNVAINPGTYNVLLRRHRTVFTVPEILTVVGPAPVTVQYTGAELSLVTPTNPDTCVVFGDIFDIDGVPDDQVSPESIIITARRTRSPIATGTRLYSLDPSEVRADASGHFEILLARNLKVNLKIPRIGLDKTFTVPDAPSADIVTLL